MNDKVYGIPCVFVVGWRGEPNVHDEPQHVFQGEITLKLFEDLDIEVFVIDKNTTEQEVEKQLEAWQPLLSKGKQVAFIVKKGALEYGGKVKYQNGYDMSREEIIKHILAVTDTDPVVSTTGKASRELFEIREELNQGHGFDFLTVGSMGHTSSIALQIAKQKPNRKIWCIDGDGAVLMHMGAMALVGSERPENLVHIVINNGAHETVGGMPTVADKIDFVKIAEGCGYPYAVSVSEFEGLDKELKSAKENNGLKFIEVKSSIGARDDLGRPTTTPKENKENFMNNL
jgi:phosphonopyruvate decarboxylase